MKTREDALALDAADPLAHLREQFAIPAGLIYLDGNSLGVMPKATPARVQQVVTQEWGVGLIGSWNSSGWMELAPRIGDKIARLIGAKPGECVAADSTSVNLFKVLNAALSITRADDPKRTRIVSERSNFPTDLYIAEATAAERGCELVLAGSPEAIPTLLDERCAVLMLTHVNYSDGRMHDMAALTKVAHDAGALALWDLAHSAGAVPVDLSGSGADFAVGCGYKYLNGGPGAPAFVWVAPKHAERFWQPLAGWMGHAAPFEFTPGYRPAPGIRRYLCGTPAVISLAALECGVDTVLAAVQLAAWRAARQVAGADTCLRRAGRTTLRRPGPDAGFAARRCPARQPGVLRAPDARLCDGAGADRARRGRRLPRAADPALRFHAAVPAFRRCLGRRRASAPGAAERGVARGGLQPEGGRDMNPSTDAAGIVRDEGAKLDFARDMSYGDYLHLDDVLNAQHPLSPDHNEMLFIVQHQTSELWMKLMLHELRAAIGCDRARPAGAGLQDAGRVSQDHGAAGARLGRAGDDDAAGVPAIRPYLANSSGFQSWQYRCIEFSLGNKNAAMLKPHQHRADLLAHVEAAYARAVAVRRGAAPAGAARPARCRQRTPSATGPSPMPPAPRSRPPGCRSTARRDSTGTCTSWARSSPTSKTPSASGASAT